jgi:hypothetical protein
MKQAIKNCDKDNFKEWRMGIFYASKNNDMRVLEPFFKSVLQYS